MRDLYHFPVNGVIVQGYICSQTYTSDGLYYRMQDKLDSRTYYVVKADTVYTMIDLKK